MAGLRSKVVILLLLTEKGLGDMAAVRSKVMIMLLFIFIP